MTARAIALLHRDDSADLARWGIAAAIVLAAHLGLIATYLLFVSHHPAGAPPAPAVLVDLSPPASPQSAMDVAPGPEIVEAPPPTPEVAQPKPEPEPIVELPPPAPEPIVALPETPKEPPPPEVKKEEPKEKPLEVKRVQRTTPAPKTTAAPRSERVAETPSAPSAGASAAAMATWRDQVVAQLQRAKRYPSGAESRREQGVATLSFSLSRNGQVLARSIARGSGYSELDQEVLAMVMRAQPFPAFPAGMTQPRVNLSVPVRFSLR